MSNYGIKERFVAKALSSAPGIKRVLKNLYVNINAAIYKAPYAFKILDNSIQEIVPLLKLKDNEEAFFGYYDKFPMNAEGWVINHVCNTPTHQMVNVKVPVEIRLVNIHNKEEISVGHSYTYNWQQGTRAQWIDNDTLVFNDFEDGIFVSKIYSLSRRKVDKILDCPVQDSSNQGFILSLNYSRLMHITADYGYKNGTKISASELSDLKNDGIVYKNILTGERTLLHSLEDIAAVGKSTYTNDTLHTVNHIMLNEAGTGFIFIHRYYNGNVRFDRLLFSDFKTLKVISDDRMVSHCCWVDNTILNGYLRHNGVDGYYDVNVETLKFTIVNKMTDLNIGDGHPSSDCGKVVFDSYPNKSRLQGLFIYNREAATVDQLIEVYQSTKFKESSRCDLHPRFSAKEKIIFFDAVFEGKRNQYYIKLS